MALIEEVTMMFSSSKLEGMFFPDTMASKLPRRCSNDGKYYSYVRLSRRPPVRVESTNVSTYVDQTMKDFR
jgi:hypothetical protein